MIERKRDNRRDPARPGWEFDPSIPTHDFFEGQPLDDPWGLQDVVESFIDWLEDERFATWEAVACEEQGLPLTAEQQDLLGGLLNFGDPADDQILYINEGPRASEPWHVIFNKLVPHLLTQPFVTWALYDEMQLDGWNRLTTALREHGQTLSLPPGTGSAEEVVPADLRHRLWLQSAFDILLGLGQEEELNLREQPWRIDEFIDRLRQIRASVSYLALTPATLMSRVTLPEADKPRFLQSMQERLGLASADEPIAVRL